jgi:hypothetical protein
MYFLIKNNLKNKRNIIIFLNIPFLDPNHLKVASILQGRTWCGFVFFLINNINL